MPRPSSTGARWPTGSHPGSPRRWPTPGRPASTPGLATVLVGDDYASGVYERRLRRLAEGVGCRFVSERMPADTDVADALATVGKLNADPRISGILIMRPLPPADPRGGAVPHPRSRQGHRGGPRRQRRSPRPGLSAFRPVDAGGLLPPAGLVLPVDRCEPPRSTTGRRSSSSAAPTTSGNSPCGSPWAATPPSCPATSTPPTPGCWRTSPGRRTSSSWPPGVPGLITADMVKDGVIAIDVGINRRHRPGHRQDTARGRHRHRSGRRARRGRHARPRRCGSDHRRVAGAQCRSGRDGAAPRSSPLTLARPMKTRPVKNRTVKNRRACDGCHVS